MVRMLYKFAPYPRGGCYIQRSSTAIHRLRNKKLAIPRAFKKKNIHNNKGTCNNSIPMHVHTQLNCRLPSGGPTWQSTSGLESLQHFALNDTTCPGPRWKEAWPCRAAFRMIRAHGKGIMERLAPPQRSLNFSRVICFRLSGFHPKKKTVSLFWIEVNSLDIHVLFVVSS